MLHSLMRPDRRVHVPDVEYDFIPYLANLYATHLLNSTPTSALTCATSPSTGVLARYKRISHAVPYTTAERSAHPHAWSVRVFHKRGWWCAGRAEQGEAGEGSSRTQRAGLSESLRIRDVRLLWCGSRRAENGGKEMEQGGIGGRMCNVRCTLLCSVHGRSQSEGFKRGERERLLHSANRPLLALALRTLALQSRNERATTITFIFHLFFWPLSEMVFMYASPLQNRLKYIRSYV
ncbi:hypothetical protein PENSPDRAFT_373880 [Peniophora sp. CONT]|nr:hypothetical protein PENSPDRAFT_373880 [Peniophora sp. CONT]